MLNNEFPVKLWTLHCSEAVVASQDLLECRTIFGWQCSTS